MKEIKSTLLLYWYKFKQNFRPNLPHLSKISKKQRSSYQTLPCNLQRRTKIWNHAKHNYKILRSWVIHRKCNLWSKFASLTQNFNTIKTVLLNSALSFAKANQNMKLYKKYLENIEQAFSYTQTMPFLPKILSFTQNCNITKTVLLNFAFSFAKAYQNLKSCLK